MEFNEPTAPLEPIILMNNLVADSLEERRPLHIAIVYQDVHTREWANQTCARVAQQVRTEPIRSSWWKLDCLEHPLLLQGAAEAAAHADIIIVAVYAMDTLPFELVHWQETWLEQRGARAGAFVALIGTSAAADAGAFSTRENLREVALRGDLHFLSQVKALAIPAGDGARAAAFVPFHAHQQVRNVPLSRSRNFHENWGINE